MEITIFRNTPSSLENLNDVLKMMGKEPLTEYPIYDIMKLKNCIKMKHFSYETPSEELGFMKTKVPLFIKSLAYAFLLTDLRSVNSFVEYELNARYLRNCFDLSYREFKELWNNIPSNWQQYIEKTTLFFCDAYYAIKDDVPISALYAKWVLCGDYKMRGREDSTYLILK